MTPYRLASSVRRRSRVLIAALLAVAGGALAFAGTAPKALATVSDAAAMDSGQHVEVRGTVKVGTVERNATPTTFVVTDGTRDLRVLWDRELPEHEAGGTLEGRIVVVTGTLERAGAALVLRASDIKVGCASKYEAA